jgi:hypothetical protein
MDKHSSPDKASRSPSEHKEKPPTENKYAILMETSGEECESWYYFLRYNGNERALKHLEGQLESIDWHVLGDLSTFDLETQILVSEQTAKEMTKVDLNHTAHHRKFDGTLEKVDLKFRKKDSNDKKMTRVFDALGYGQIEDYIDHEDVDAEDLTDASDEAEPSGSESDEASGSDEEEEEDEEKTSPKKKKGIPPALLASNLPRIARAKQHRRRKNHL